MVYNLFYFEFINQYSRLTEFLPVVTWVHPENTLHMFSSQSQLQSLVSMKVCFTEDILLTAEKKQAYPINFFLYDSFF